MDFCNKLEYVPGKPFQPSLMLWLRPGAYPRVMPLKRASLGHSPVLPTNIRLG